MIDDLKPLAIFVCLVDKGSFRAAAEHMGLSPSVVSYHLKQLELKVGTALLYRTTRKMNLSFEGEQLYRHAAEMVRSAQSALVSLDADSLEPSGVLTLSLPSLLVRSSLNQRLAEFALKTPKLTLNIQYSDERQDLISDSIDLTVRLGNLQDSTYKYRSFGKLERVLVASPNFLSRHNHIRQLSDLANFPWVGLAMMPNNRKFKSKAGKSAAVSFQHQVSVNSVGAMTQFCIDGVGLATPPKFLIEQDLREKRLIQVLPSWHAEPIEMNLVWHGNSVRNRNVQRLIRFLCE